MDTLTDLVDQAENQLHEAGIVTARQDAEQLAEHVFDEPDGEPDERLLAAFRDLVGKRADRIPLGHLTGSAVLGGVRLAVGPGVFVPRPHSELVLSSGLDAIASTHQPLVVDLCSGSGAIALAVAHARSDATVHAVELDPHALDFAKHNSETQALRGDTPIVIHQADVTAPGLLAELAGTVDLVLANPPFVPERTELLPEYGVHHPRQAIFSGVDGLNVIRHIIGAAATLLRPGGGLVVEHGHLHGRTVPALLRADTRFQDVSSHLDHDERPLYSVALHRLTTEPDGSPGDTHVLGKAHR